MAEDIELDVDSVITRLLEGKFTIIIRVAHTPAMFHIVLATMLIFVLNSSW